jgi:hypothetical protein
MSTTLQTILPADAHLSRETIFAWGGNIKQSVVFDIPSRNYKANSFQNRRTEFKRKVNWNKK